MCKSEHVNHLNIEWINYQWNTSNGLLNISFNLLDYFMSSSNNTIDGLKTPICTGSDGQTCKLKDFLIDINNNNNNTQLTCPIGNGNNNTNIETTWWYIYCLNKNNKRSLYAV